MDVNPSAPQITAQIVRRATPVKRIVRAPLPARVFQSGEMSVDGSRRGSFWGVGRGNFSRGRH
jgi:hypothetical protein